MEIEKRPLSDFGLDIKSQSQIIAEICKSLEVGEAAIVPHKYSITSIRVAVFRYSSASSESFKVKRHGDKVVIGRVQ